MSTLGVFVKPIAAAVGAAALLAAPAVGSATPFTPDPMANCEPGALEVEKTGDEVSWEFEVEDNPDATIDTQVSYLNLGQAGPTVGMSGPLLPREPGEGQAAQKDLPGFTAHLVPGGTYDPDGTEGTAATCTLGFGFAVTQ